MNQPMLNSSRWNQRGFTLIEVLIVVAILGILAAIVIPQFSNASTSARQSNLTTQLQALQEQISYYKMQHNANPPLITTGWTVLTEYTDINGNVSATSDATHIYGPYFPNPPQNPLTAPANASVIAASPGTGPGWVYSESTGKIYATGTNSTEYFNPADNSDSATAPY